MDDKKILASALTGLKDELEIAKEGIIKERVERMGYDYSTLYSRTDLSFSEDDEYECYLVEGKPIVTFVKSSLVNSDGNTLTIKYY